ncbi:MAG: hypothetical protein K0T01_1652 [Acidimicrobiia bacterium]|nr:hypothetical protein [Acidimicrobiia bacterium]
MFRLPRGSRNFRVPSSEAGRLGVSFSWFWVSERTYKVVVRTNDQSTSKEFPDDPVSVRAARDFVRDVLELQGIPTESARLAISELATNVVQHAHTPFQVSVLVEAEAVRIEVEDGAGTLKIATDLSSDRTGGGLRIVETMAVEWGVENRGEKKAVWVRLPSPTDASADRPD